MLVLTRKPHESVMIGHDIEVAVNSVRGNHVSLAFKVPDDVRVVRKEIYDSAHTRPAPLNVPPPAGVFVVVHHSVDDLNIAPLAFVNRARALAVAEAWAGKQLVVTPPGEDRVCAFFSEGQRSVAVYHLPVE